MRQMAITVNEPTPGDFHYTLIEEVGDRAGLLIFRRLETHPTAYASEMEAWIAGVCTINERIVRPIAHRSSQSYGSKVRRSRGASRG